MRWAERTGAGQPWRAVASALCGGAHRGDGWGSSASRGCAPPKLDFAAGTDGSVVGKRPDPDEEFFRIDGPHRRAAQEFFGRTQPDDAKAIAVPCAIFEGRTEYFATEMIMTIDSPPTRINKSHLVDLEARVAWAEPVREFKNAGFYERFPAKGQGERVARIHRELGRWAGIAAKTKG